MSESTKPMTEGSDWTHLLTDPDLVTHLSVLLQTYREVSPEKRGQALLAAMREIKERAARERAAKEHTAPAAEAEPLPSPQPVTETPPFEPDFFAPTMSSDRRKFTRMKCNVAVELRVDGTYTPVWGTLVNVGRGGCMVETARLVPTDKVLQIGLWVASGKIWVKGVIIRGISTGPATSSGVRVQFSRSELSEKEHLREFLKFVEGEAHKSQSEKSYVAKLKR
ncbi:MAG TPA: PilZ domain-containing protein [Terriglobales bacterium]|nr:PilZ domain-containing protein [Terriglobales bacterium]